ncbi:hypothetical protein GGS26DRAFT_592090 [Hypomontagnella submonticulosa]|nr:hypothetical protein GGS26DRAFT_592090 [Hypomontagnella submonticulosa]
MKPPLVAANPRAVHLKYSKPANVPTAYMEEHWNNAANLAWKRYRATKDPVWSVKSMRPALHTVNPVPEGTEGYLREFDFPDLYDSILADPGAAKTRRTQHITRKARKTRKSQIPPTQAE